MFTKFESGFDERWADDDCKAAPNSFINYYSSELLSMFEWLVDIALPQPGVGAYTFVIYQNVTSARGGRRGGVIGIHFELEGALIPGQLCKRFLESFFATCKSDPNSLFAEENGWLFPTSGYFRFSAAHDIKEWITLWLQTFAGALEQPIREEPTNRQRKDLTALSAERDADLDLVIKDLARRGCTRIEKRYHLPETKTEKSVTESLPVDPMEPQEEIPISDKMDAVSGSTIPVPPVPVKRDNAGQDGGSSLVSVPALVTIASFSVLLTTLAIEAYMHNRDRDFVISRLNELEGRIEYKVGELQIKLDAASCKGGEIQKGSTWLFGSQKGLKPQPSLSDPCSSLQQAGP